MKRDAEQRETLLSSGWKILVVWEKDIKRKSTREDALLAIKNFLLSES